MSSIDNRVVILTFDNKDFEQNVSTSIKTLDKLKNGLKLDGASKGLDAISASAKTVNLGPIGSAVESLKERFSSLGVVGMTVLQNLTNTALNFGKKLVGAVFTPITQGGWKRALNVEQATFQMEGLIGKTENGAQKIKAIMDSVTASVQGTAYGADEAARVASQLVATGIEDSQQMLKYLQGVAGAAAMTGGSYDEIGHIFTTIAGQGKLMGEQLNQFAYKGLNVAATLSKQMNMTEAEFRDLVKKGKISFEQFAEGMAEAFGEHATKANETFTGSLSNMKAALARIGQEFATPALTNFRDIFLSLRGLIDAVHEALKPLINLVNDHLTKATQKAVEFIDSLTDKVKSLLPEVKKETEETAEATEESAERISKSAEEIEEAAQKVMRGDYGNGEERRKQLEALGYSYERVQNRVNELMNNPYRYEVEEEAEATEELAETTDEAAEALKELNEKQKRLNELTRDRALVQVKVALKNIASGLVGVFKAGGTAFKNVFSSKEFSDGLLNITTKFRNFTDNLKLNEEQTAGLSKIFEGFFGIIKKGASLVGKGAGIVIDFGGKLVGAGKSLLEFIGGMDKLQEEGVKPTRLQRAFIVLHNIFKAFGDTLVSFKDHLKEVWDNFKETEGFKRLSESFSRLWETLKNIGGSIFDKIANKFEETFKKGVDFTWVDKLAGYLEKAANKLADLINWCIEGIPRIKEFFEDIKEAAGGKFDGFLTFLKTAKDYVVELFKGTGDEGDAKVTFFSRLKKMFEDGFANVGEFFNSLNVEGFISSLKNFIARITGSGSEIDWQNVFGFLKRLGVAILQILLIVNTIKAIKSIKEAFSSLGDLFTNLGEKFKPRKLFELSNFGKAVIGLAAAVAALYVISTIPYESLKRSVISLSIIMGEMLAIFIIVSKIPTDESKMKAFAASMAGLGVGLLAMVAAAKILSGMDWAQIADAAGKIAVFAGIMAVAARIGGNNHAGSSFLALAVALNLMLIPIKALSKMKTGEINKAIKAIGAIALELGLAARLAGTVKAAAAFMGLAVAINLLLPAFAILGHMRWETIEQGAIALGIIVGELALACRIASSANSGKGALELLAMSVAIVAAIAGIKVLGEMPRDNLIAGAVALGSIILACGIAIKLAQANSSGVTSLVAMCGSIAIATMALYALKDVPWETLLAGGTALAEIMLSVGIAMKLAAGAQADSALALAVVSLALLPMVWALSQLGDYNWKSLLAAGTAMSELLITIGVVLTLTRGLDVGGAVMSSIAFSAGLDVILLNLSGILALIGWFEEISNGAFKENIQKGGEILEAAATAIGNMVAAFGEAATSTLPDIGANLTAFSESASGFFTMMSQNGLSAAAAITELSVAFGLLTGAELIDGLKKLFTGESTLGSFGEELASFAESYSTFAEKTGGATSAQNVSAVASAIGDLADAAAKIPNQGNSLAKGLLGDNSLGTFGKELEGFIPGLEAISSSSAKNLKPGDFAGIADAISTLSEAASTIPNQGKSLLKGILGDNTLSTFGEELEGFIPGLEAINNSSVKNIKAGDFDGVASAISSLTSAAAKIPNQGKSVLKAFVGDNTLSSFGTELSQFCGSLTEAFTTGISAIKAGDFDGVASAISSLGQAASDIPNQGLSVLSVFTGDNRLSDFGEELVKFSESLSTFASNVSPGQVLKATIVSKVIKALTGAGDGITGGTMENLSSFGSAIVLFSTDISTFASTISAQQGNIETANSVIESLGELVSGISSIDTSGLSSVSDALSSFSASGLEGLTSGFSEGSGSAASSISGVLDGIASDVSGSTTFSDKFKEIAQNAIDDFKGLFDSESGNAKSKVKAFMDSAKNAIPSDFSNKFRNTATEAVNSFVNGLSAGGGRASGAAASLASSATHGLSSNASSSTWYNVGVQCVNGFINGLASGLNSVIQTAVRLATSAINAARNALQQHSPSRVFYDIGENTWLGFVIAMRDGLTEVAASGTALGNKAVNSAKEQIKRVRDAFNVNADFKPVITPVVDLTNIQNGTRQINSMFGTAGVGLKLGNNPALLNRLAFMSNTGTVEDANNRDVVNAINDLKGGMNNVTFNITVDGAENPENFADRLVRSLKGYSKTRV